MRSRSIARFSPTGLLTLLLTSAIIGNTLAEPIAIAHRGASGYLPEHTLPAKALAHAQGAHFIEQDVVLSKDGVPVVLHDIHLESTTNVASMFPGRSRDDGHFYAIDFSLTELKQLHAHERRNADGTAVFPNRFPLGPGLSQVPTLLEEIQLIDGLNRTRDHKAGLYIELKGFAFHKAEGQDLAATVLNVLDATGWADRSDAVYLQSFEPDALRYLRSGLGTQLPLIQLIGENDWAEDGEVDFTAMRSEEGLAAVAEYAQGIGPWVMQLYLGRESTGGYRLSDLARRAHEHGLLVHPFTLRADQLPPGLKDFQELHQVLFDRIGVDGVFTDFPDQTIAFLQRKRQ
ncbi:MAG: glycerophosphodiester phosphodiesterase [Pseudomonadota bacterium]